MKRNFTFVLCLAIFSLIDGYLLSGISLVGRTGINFFYTQYKFLKTWWIAALLVLLVWLLLFTIQLIASKKISRNTLKSIYIISMIAGIAGMYVSYVDFRDLISHRLLGERFHIGVYLFWLGWISISIFFLTGKRISPMEIEKAGDFRSQEKDPFHFN